MNPPSNGGLSGLDQVVRALDALSERVDVHLDPVRLREAVADAWRDGGGPDDHSAWAERLARAGDRLRLAVRHVAASPADAATIAGGRLPLLTARPTQDGLRWWILGGRRRGRLRLVPLDEADGGLWVAPDAVCSTLGVSPTTTLLWAVVEPGSWQGASGEGGQAPYDVSDPISPARRVFRMLRPERRDLGIVVLFAVTVGLLNLATPIAVQNLVNNVAFGTLLQPLVVLAVIVFGSLMLAGALRAVQVVAAEFLQRRLFVRMVGDVAWRLPRARTDAFAGGDGGELVNRFFDVFTVQKAVAGLLLDGVSVALQAVVGMLLLAFYHPFLLAFDALLVGALFFIVVILGRGAIATAIKESKRKYQVVWWLEQVGRHAMAFKQSGGGAFARDRADALARTWLDARQAHFSIHLRQVMGALLFQALASTGLLVLGGFLVIERQLTLGQLVAAEIVVASVVASFAKLGKHLEAWYDLVAAADKLGDLLDVPVEHDTGDDLPDVQHPLAVQLRDTNIAAAGRCWLKGASVSIRPGARLAILGGPGSGKSHVAEAIAGLQLPNGGQILLDQVDTRELRPMQRGRFAVMARDPAFLSGTVAENIRMGRVEVSVADVRWALRILGIDDAVHSLPDGIRTRLDSEGRPLGEEERDLLMLARAIVGRPRLLVVDGMLDRISPEARRRTLMALSAPGAPWTFVLTTRDEALAEELSSVWELEDGTIHVRREAGPASRVPPPPERSPG